MSAVADPKHSFPGSIGTTFKLKKCSLGLFHILVVVCTSALRGTPKCLRGGGSGVMGDHGGVACGVTREIQGFKKIHKKCL